MKRENATYKRLGDYIREVDVRNSNDLLDENDLFGVSVNKEFIPTHANLVGVQFHNYKIVKNRQFTYISDTSRRGDKIALALNLFGKNIIVSNVYTTFEVDEDHLLPEYLMMWFRRPEFDRYARFKSHGSAREVFDWSEMCDVMMPIPDIAEQQRIVNRYNAIQKRIETNKQTIAKLEEAAQALYRKMFIDNIDPNNLPPGWRIGTIKEFCKEIKSGGTPSRTNNSYWDSKDVSWLKSGEVHNNVILETEDYISVFGLKNSSAKLIPENSVVMAMYGATAAEVAYLKCTTTTNQACCNMICHSKEDAAYLYFHLRYNQEDIKKLANGGAQENLSQELIANQPIILCSVSNKFATIIEQIFLLTKEHKLLTEMLSLLMFEKKK